MITRILIKLNFIAPRFTERQQLQAKGLQPINTLSKH